MSRGVVIHLDNDRKKYLDPCKNMFDQSGIDLDYLTCESKEEFRDLIKKHGSDLKALVFDLLRSDPGNEGLSGENPEFLEYVKSSFADYNIPIFIFSGYLHALGDLCEKNGTVYKLDKVNDGFEVVVEKIKLLHQSGFIDVFCAGGTLEKQLHLDLHKAFTKQFLKSSEIEKIITNIKGNNENFDETSGRIKKVFKRVAIRSLLSDLLLPDIDENGMVKEESVNTVEHYIRRIGDIPVWTGDLFKKNDSDDFLFVLTPRCNVIRSESILVCPFVWKEVITKKDKISKMLQGDPTVSGYDRHLPPSPVFEGGKLSLSKYFMIKKEVLANDYKLHITLSDELTNEILGKFGAHFFRTGITPWDSTEVADIING
ncbi:MAG: hypothetical protein AB3N18_09935 [Allomuricauda sp.]